MAADLIQVGRDIQSGTQTGLGDGAAEGRHGRLKAEGGVGRRGLHGVLRIGVRHFREQLLRRLDHLGRLGLCAVGQKMLHGLQHALDGVWLEHHSGVSQRQRQTRERRGCVDLQLRLGRRHDQSGRLRRAAVEQMEPRRGADHQRVEESAAVARDQRQGGRARSSQLERKPSSQGRWTETEEKKRLSRAPVE